MRSSAVQPSESIFVAASQMASHEPSGFDVPTPSASNFTPDGLTSKKARPRWSWYASITTSK